MAASEDSDNKGRFIWAKMPYLGGKIIPTRSRRNANIHQQKSSVHMTWKFSHLTEIPPTVDPDLGEGDIFSYERIFRAGRDHGTIISTI